MTMLESVKSYRKDHSRSCIYLYYWNEIWIINGNYQRKQNETEMDYLSRNMKTVKSYKRVRKLEGIKRV